MIIDKLENAHLYYEIDKKIASALIFLKENDFDQIKSGKRMLLVT